MSSQQPMVKGNKYRSISKEQNSQHLQQISRIGLFMEMINPVPKINKQQGTIRNNRHQFNKLSLQFLQSLHMDLTPYQTLKQLIVQNKQLSKQSQSAYFLSKQSQKLINFIDGWNHLSKNTYNENDFLLIQQVENKKISTKKRRVSQNKSQTIYKQQQRQLMKQQLKQQQRIRQQGQQQLKRIDEIIIRKKVSQKLSTKPALILDQQSNKNHKILDQQTNKNNKIKQQDYQDQEQIQIQIEQISQQRYDQNNINSSNIILRQQQSERVKQNKPYKQLNKGQTKVIKLYNNKTQLNQNNQNYQNYDRETNQHNQNYDKEININIDNKIIQENILNQIIRPQYQKTQVSFSSNSSLSQSRDSEILHVPIKKKTIPLLKKGKQSNISYNEVMTKKEKFSYQQQENKIQQIVLNKEKNINQNKIDSQYNNKLNTQYNNRLNNQYNNRVQSQLIEKGFQSEDTDANSRLTIITNRPKIIITEQGRSVSPKVQGRKKVVVKLSSNINKRELTQKNQIENRLTASKEENRFTGSKEEDRLVKQKEQASKPNMRQQQKPINSISISSSLQQTNKLQRQLQQLQQQFMNMNIRKSIQKQQQQNITNTNHINQNQIEQDQQQNLSNQTYLSEQENQLFTKKITNQNKTLQLIMKSQKNKSTQQKTTNINTYNNNNLTNNNNNNRIGIKNPQLNSIVLEQQPWQCDQLQLQQQLKAIDQKIQDRKSILSKRQLNQTQNYNSINFNQTLNINPSFTQLLNPSQQNLNYTSNLENINKLNNKHKRSNTTVNPQQKQIYLKQKQRTYTEHLFEDQQPQYQHQQLHQTQHHNQPKVVRLSLTALANNLNKKSRDSLKNHHNHQLNNIHKNHTLKQNQQKTPIPYSHQFHKNPSQNKLQKDPSVNKLQKEPSMNKLQKEPSMTKLQKQPSCKSISLFEQASRRGISPSKSNRSLRSNNRNVSPIKQYTQKDQLGGNQTNNIVRTPRNLHKKEIKQRQPNLQTYQRDSVAYLGNHSPSPINRDNRSRTPQNKGRQQISNFSPLQCNNEHKNKVFYVKNQQNYSQEFSSHSRTFSDMIDSEYSRAKKMGYGQKNNFNSNEMENIGRHRYDQTQYLGNNQYLMRENGNDKDHSMFSNCERYLYPNEQNEQCQGQMIQNEVMMAKKWKAPLNYNKNISSVNKNRTKVLLSDQLGG